MSWNKVWVLEGEPFYFKYIIEEIKEELSNPEIIKFDTNSSADDVKSALTAFPFFDVPDLIIIDEPKAEVLNMCLDLVESNFHASGLIITCAYNNFDGRQSFISKASKKKKINYVAHTMQGDSLKQFIQDWAEHFNVTLKQECYSWLQSYAPTRTAKVKINNQKKDVIIYDLIMLDKELAKINAIYSCDKKPIESNDLANYCNFKRENDIWQFIDKAIEGDLSVIVKYFSDNKLSSSNEGVLWLLASQLELYIQVKSALGNKLSESEIQDEIALKGSLNYYLGDNFEPLPETKPKAALNPYRLQMAIRSCSTKKIESLVDKYRATISAIMDLRSGINGEIVSGLLGFAYSEKTKYLQPFVDV